MSKNLRAAHILEGKVVDENDPLGQKTLSFDEEAYYSSPWDTDEEPTPDNELPPSTQWWVHQVRSMDLKLPLEEETEFEENLFEDEETLECIASHLRHVEKRSCHPQCDTNP